MLTFNNISKGAYDTGNCHGHHNNNLNDDNHQAHHNNNQNDNHQTLHNDNILSINKEFLLLT